MRRNAVRCLALNHILQSGVTLASVSTTADYVRVNVYTRTSGTCYLSCTTCFIREKYPLARNFHTAIVPKARQDPPQEAGHTDRHPAKDIPHTRPSVQSRRYVCITFQFATKNTCKSHVKHVVNNKKKKNKETEAATAASQANSDGNMRNSDERCYHMLWLSGHRRHFHGRGAKGTPVKYLGPR